MTFFSKPLHRYRCPIQPRRSDKGEFVNNAPSEDLHVSEFCGRKGMPRSAFVQENPIYAERQMSMRFEACALGAGGAIQAVCIHEHASVSQPRAKSLSRSNGSHGPCRPSDSEKVAQGRRKIRILRRASCRSYSSSVTLGMLSRLSMPVCISLACTAMPWSLYIKQSAINPFLNRHYHPLERPHKDDHLTFTRRRHHRGPSRRHHHRFGRHLDAIHLDLRQRLFHLLRLVYRQGPYQWACQLPIPVQRACAEPLLRRQRWKLCHGCLHHARRTGGKEQCTHHLEAELRRWSVRGQRNACSGRLCDVACVLDGDRGSGCLAEWGRD